MIQAFFFSSRWLLTSWLRSIPGHLQKHSNLSFLCRQTRNQNLLLLGLEWRICKLCLDLVFVIAFNLNVVYTNFYKCILFNSGAQPFHLMPSEDWHEIGIELHKFVSPSFGYILNESSTQATFIVWDKRFQPITLICPKYCFFYIFLQ